MHSCSKQEITDQPVTGNKEVAMSAGDLDIFNKIVSFKEKITYIRENPSYKSGEFTTVDSAIWYLDATLNLSHAFISWETLSGFHYDSVFVTIPKVNGVVNYTDLADAYVELKQKVANVCIEAPGSEKELYIATLTEKEDTGNSITIKAETTIGSRSTPPDHHPFYEGWLYGDLAGNCVGSPPYIGVADACTQLRDKTNLYRHLYIDDEQMFYIGTPNEEPYVTLRSQHFAFINPDDPDPDDNYYERLLVYQKQEFVYHYCIEEDEMNWYYEKLRHVIYLMVPNNPIYWPNANGKTFIEIKTDPDPIDGTYGTEDELLQIIRHQYKVEYRYGFYVGGNSEPESIVEN